MARAEQLAEDFYGFEEASADRHEVLTEWAAEQLERMDDSTRIEESVSVQEAAQSSSAAQSAPVESNAELGPTRAESRKRGRSD